MKQETLHLLNNYCEQTIGQPLQSCRPFGLAGYDTLEYLWPVNEIFKPLLHRLKTVSYREQYETAADEAIRDFVLNDADLSLLPINVLRVLLERHQQAILLCVANAMAENENVIFMPVELSPSARTKFAVVFLWHAMTLPFPVTDESQLDIDSPFEHLSGRLH